MSKHLIRYGLGRSRSWRSAYGSLDGAPGYPPELYGPDTPPVTAQARERRHVCTVCLKHCACVYCHAPDQCECAPLNLGYDK